MDTFGAPARGWAPQPALTADWSNLPAIDRAAQPGNAGFWATDQPRMWTYDQRNSASQGVSYDPANASGSMYDPASTFTHKIIQNQVQDWLRDEHPELYDFSSGIVNAGPGGGGSVSRNPSFGGFARDPAVFAEIEAAANTYGVPANFLKTIIAKESSGNWSGGNLTPQWVGSHSPELGLIHGYVGVFEKAASSRGLGQLWQEAKGNRAKQIELLAGVLKSQLGDVQKQNPNYSWINVAAYHYSGDPSGNTNPAGWEQHGTTRDYMARTQEWWDQEDAWTSANGGTVGTGRPTVGGLSSPNNGSWAPVNQWDAMVANAAAKYGVPANLVKSVIRFESNGNRAAQSPQGATGLMQIMPNLHNNGNTVQLYDPAYNIDLGTRILRDYFRASGSWAGAAKQYLGLSPKGDAFGTTASTYWQRVSGFWSELDRGMGGGQPAYGGQPSGSNGPTTSLSAIWGNVPGLGEVSQEHGPTQFARDHPSWYEYSRNVLGELGHPGIDLSMPVGTKLYSPVSGTVSRADDQAGYSSTTGGGPQTGGLRIRTANGHEVILGHMAGIYVTPGTQITAGQLVGVSGNYNGGHLHLEWRVPNNAFTGGWQAIDPREALRGAFSGGFTENTSAPGIGRPMTFAEMMKASAMGKPVDYGMTVGGESSWNSWLQDAMAGRIPAGGTTKADPFAFLSVGR